MAKVIRGLGNIDVRVMFDGMKCRSCHRFPSPFYRFICDDSHLLCASCAYSKFENNGGICSTKLEGPRNLVTGRLTKGPGPKSLTTCQKPVTRYPADPVYTAFFNRSMWNCPGTIDPEKDDDPSSGGCTAIVKGENLFAHLQTEHEQPTQKKRKVCDDWDYGCANGGSYEMHIDKKPKSGGSGKK